MPKRTAHILLLLPGLYLLVIGAHLWWSPRHFVRVHKLPFYPPRFKRAINAIAAHERASRRVGLAATVAGAACLLMASAQRQPTV